MAAGERRVLSSPTMEVIQVILPSILRREQDEDWAGFTFVGSGRLKRKTPVFSCGKQKLNLQTTLAGHSYALGLENCGQVKGIYDLNELMSEM